VSDIPLTKDKEALKEIARALKLLDDKRRYTAIDFFVPYPKQVEFFDAGGLLRERLLMAGNQLGKTQAGAVEMVYHLTGEYPDDWFGRRWDRAITAWACGESSLVVRDVQQSKLCGEPGLSEAFGTGFIPKAAFVGNPSSARGVTDAYDTIHVRHKSGGISTLTFKSYEQGRKKFQGKPVDVIWLDEEPAEDIYIECLTRVTATKGMVYTTFTPLQGRTTLVKRFLDEKSVDRLAIIMTIKDAAHISPEERAKIIAGYPLHEREARANGVPMMGSGRIFITPEEHITEPRIERVPSQWSKLWSIDFGIGHPFAAVLSAWDRDLDIIHVLHAFRIADQTPLQHAVQMKQIGINVPVAWPQDGTQREKSGETVSKLYKMQGLKMCDSHATFEDGGYGTEAGILEMDERHKTGRLKYAEHLSELLEEYRFYHRKDGLIVKVNDDIMSAVRIGIMAKRWGRAVILGGRKPMMNNGPNAGMASHVELSGSDLF
jgi:phage terminase large subunit-like protein